MAQAFTRMMLSLATILAAAAAVAEDPGHRHHHQFPQDVDSFHSLLAPIWHANPGKARSQNACARAADMAAAARGIRSADATPLVSAVAGLESACKGKPAAVDAALSDVHEAFHRLIDARPAASSR